MKKIYTFSAGHLASISAPRLFVALRPRELLVCGARRGVAFFSKSSRQLRLILLVFITSRPSLLATTKAPIDLQTRV